MHACIIPTNIFSSVVRFLASKTEQPNIPDDEGDTPLMMAIESGSKQIVKILLELNADPCIPNEAQNYPMHIAAKEGAVDIMTLLIEASDIDPQTFISIIKIFIS